MHAKLPSRQKVKRCFSGEISVFHLLKDALSGEISVLDALSGELSVSFIKPPSPASIHPNPHEILYRHQNC